MISRVAESFVLAVSLVATSFAFIIRVMVQSTWGVEFGLGWDRSTYPTGSLERTSRLRGRAAILHRRGDRTRSGWAGPFAIENAWRAATRRQDEESEIPSTAQLSEAVTQLY